MCAERITSVTRQAHYSTGIYDVANLYSYATQVCVNGLILYTLDDMLHPDMQTIVMCVRVIVYSIDFTRKYTTYLRTLWCS